MVTEHLRDRILAVDATADCNSIDEIGRGWGSVAYRVPSRAGDWVLRVPRFADGYLMGGDLRREQALMQYLRQYRLPIPKEIILFENNSGQLLGALHKYMHGMAANVYLQQAHANRTRFCETMGCLLAQIHSFPVTDELQAAVPTFDLYPDKYIELIERTLDKLSDRSRAWVIKMSREFAAQGGSSGAPSVLVHGDIAPHHILVNQGGEVNGFIDFGESMIADPALDLAGIIWSFGRTLGSRIMKSYSEHGGYIDANFHHRVEFYWQMVPLFFIADGDQVDDGSDFHLGIRQLAARVAAYTKSH